MTWLGVASWLIVGIGVALVLTGVNASRYFAHQQQLMGRNWVLTALYRTTVTITVVSGWLTIARSITLIWGSQWWVGLISGLAIVWLLLIPIRLRKFFESNEGR